MAEGNGWSQYEKLVLSDLKDVKDGLLAMREEMASMRVDVGQLKVKASIWGAATGALSGLLARFIPGMGGH